MLVSGGGDGGLQDLLRFLTRRPSARAVLEAVGLDERDIEVDAAIHSVERRTERARNWSLGFSFDKAYFREMHEFYSQMADRLLGRPGLREKVREVARLRPVKTTLVTYTPYFTATYGLNRFLAHLFLRALNADDPDVLRADGLGNDAQGAVVHLAPWAIDRIDPDTSRGMPPVSTPEGCLGYPWAVHLERSSGDGPPGIVRPADTVVVRHGLTGVPVEVDPDEPLSKGPRPAPPIHLHPFAK